MHEKVGTGDRLARLLFNVLKDHNNQYVNEMVIASNGHCIQSLLADCRQRQNLLRHNTLQELPHELLLSSPNSSVGLLMQRKKS
jgi:hypothetical protein